MLKRLGEGRRMKELNVFRKIIGWLKSLFISEGKIEEMSDKAKREMCQRAVAIGVCPHACDICAWSTLR